MDRMGENKFPARLRELRERQRRKQYAIAECCGISHRTLRRYETGEKEPSVESLKAIADYFEVSMDYLCGRTDNPAMNP